MKPISKLATVGFILLAGVCAVTAPVGAQDASPRLADSRRSPRYAGPKQERKDTNTAPLTSALIAKSLKDAIENTSFCARHYLVQVDSETVQNYKMCAGGALNVFSDQVSNAGEPTDVQVIVQVNEAKRLIVLWSDVQLLLASSNSEGTVAGPAAQAAFQECVVDYDANVAFCNGHYPAGNPNLAVCLEGAKQVLKGCLGAIAN